MKSYIFTITVITTIWQPLCFGMLSQETTPTLESLFSLAAISHDICKMTFEHTTQPICKDDITKYLLVKQAMQDNGLKFLSVNAKLKPSHFQLSPLFPDDSDLFESCNAYSYLEDFEKKKEAILLKNIAAHSQLPRIIALDTFIRLEPTSRNFEYHYYDAKESSQCFDDID